MKAHHGPHPPTLSPSSRGGEKDDKQKEAKYRALATKAMIKIARDLRQRHTDAEIILWEALRNRRLADLKFRRQHPIANTSFVADFLCYQYRLVIEVDGEIHNNQTQEDRLRQVAIEENGYQIARFSNDEILNNLEDVLIQILSICEHTPLALRDAQGVGVMPTKSSDAAPAQGRG